MAKDMTRGSPAKLILLFSLPLMLGNLFQQLYNTVDAAVVGNFVSEAALSAVGTCASLTNFFVCFAMGFCNGSGVVVAQFFGARREDELRRTVSTVLILVAGMGLAFSVMGFVGARWMLVSLIKVPESLMEMSVTYFRIYACGIIFQFVYNVIAAILRALGDSRATLYFLIISSALNILLDLLAVLVLELGVAGVALATIVSQAVSAAVSVVYMLRNYPQMRFKREEFRFHADKCALVLKLAVPTTVQQCVVAGSGVVMQRLVNSMSVSAIAAYTVGVRLESYLVVPITAVNVGLMTYTAQNIGANMPERVSRGWKAAELMSFGFCFALVALVYGFTAQLIGIFNLSGESFELGIVYLRGMAPCFLIFSLYLISTGVLQGAGDMLWGAGLTTASLVTRVIFSYLLYYAADMGFAALWWALPISWGGVCIVAFLRYRSGNWRKKAVVSAQVD